MKEQDNVFNELKSLYDKGLIVEEKTSKVWRIMKSSGTESLSGKE